VPYLKRLAFHTITKEQAKQGELYHLSGSKSEEIDCLFETDDVDVENRRKALDCYVTYRENIERSGIKDHVQQPVPFEVFQECHDPELSDLFEGLSEWS
jgi:hypothetical protein